MSNLYKRRLPLAGIDTEGMSPAELQNLVRQLFDFKIHGVCFSPYVDGQTPGIELSEAQIHNRLEAIRPYTHWIRTFSCTEGNEQIPSLAKKMDLRTLVGIWLDDDLENNERELENAGRLADLGHVDILAVGNEVLLRGELREGQLLDYMERARSLVSGIPVGYVDAYFKFEEHPAVTEACDVLLINCYPFWEGCAPEYAILYMKDMYRRAVRCAGGKPVIVSETGWPNAGAATGAAEPGYDHAIKYLVDTYRWAEEDDVDIFYFSAFDEAWKIGAEGDVGAFWGLLDKDGKPKYLKH